MKAETERLILRPWQERDLEPFAALNADPEVMRYFPSRLTPEQSAAYLARMVPLAEIGLGFLAVEEKATGDLVGLVGMAPVRQEFPCAPAVEIGWRLARRHWGKGYASEAARAWLAHGFGELGLDEIVAFTFAGNQPSRRVMERLGMRRNPADDFPHPGLAADHPQRPHVLYRLSSVEFRQPAAPG